MFYGLTRLYDVGCRMSHRELLAETRLHKKGSNVGFEIRFHNAQKMSGEKVLPVLRSLKISLGGLK